MSSCLPKPGPNPKQNRLGEMFMGRRGERRKGRRVRGKRKGGKKRGGREGRRREGAEGLSGLIFYDSTKLNSKAIHQRCVLGTAAFMVEIPRGKQRDVK